MVKSLIRLIRFAFDYFLHERSPLYNIIQNGIMLLKNLSGRDISHLDV